MPSKTINYHCRRCCCCLGSGSLELAHFSTKKKKRHNLLPRALLAVCLLAVLASAATRSTSAANLASSATASASASAATIGHNQHQLQPPRVAASNKWEQQQHQITRRHQEAEAEQLLDELSELEARPSNSLDECAHWYNLNLRHRELVLHLLQAEPAPRPGAIQKESECDAMEQVMAELRERMDKFKRLLRAEKRQIEFVGELANEYLELMNAAPENEYLARELAGLRSSGTTQRTLEELEHLLDFIGGLAVERAAGGEPQAMAGSSLHGSRLGPAHKDDLAELDFTLRRLIDREPELDSDELGQLAELGGVLERRLTTDHALDLGSGRFRALSGTLDAVRAIVMHRLAEEEEADRRARELAQEEAELASRRWSVRDRMSNLSAQLAAPKIPPPVVPQTSQRINPLVAASSVAAAAGPVGGAATSAATTNFKLGRERLQTPMVATPLAMGSTGTPAMASASATASAGAGTLANRRSPLMTHARL